MQSLARGGLSATQVEALIRAERVSATWGVDLLYLDGRKPEDISGDVEACTVEYNLDADVHRLVRLTVNRVLDWPNVRVRPWQQVGTARFNQGLFGLETPKQSTATGNIPVQGYDLGSLLNEQVADTIVGPKDAGMLAFATSIIERADVPDTDIRFDPAGATKTFTAALTWALNVARPDTWQMVANDALGAAAYRPVWLDPDGRFRSAPLTPMAQRQPEWLFDLVDKGTDVVEPDRTKTDDGFARTNWWGFIYSELGTRPVDGTGMYIVDRSNGARKVRAWVPLNVADQDTLVAQGDDRVAKDTARTRQTRITTGIMPQLDHEDIVELRDPKLGSGMQLISQWTADYKAKKTTITLQEIDDGD